MDAGLADRARARESRDRGCVLEQGAVRDVLVRPAHPYTQQKEGPPKGPHEAE